MQWVAKSWIQWLFEFGPAFLFRSGFQDFMYCYMEILDRWLHDSEILFMDVVTSFQIRGSRKLATLPLPNAFHIWPTDSSRVLLLAFEIYVGRSVLHKSFEVKDQALVLDRPAGVRSLRIVASGRRLHSVDIHSMLDLLDNKSELAEISC